MISFKFLSRQKVERLLDEVKVSNKRYCRALFEKYFGDNDGKWLVEYDDEEPVAMCFLKFNYPVYRYTYVNEIQAFVSGKQYGRRLLKHVFARYRHVWLVKGLLEKDTLLDYYRTFYGLNETSVWLDFKGKHRLLHIFSKGCIQQLLREVWQES